MQLARLLEPRRQRSVYAKLRQMVRALEIERQLTKDQILDLYLTLAPFGGNLEGVRAASIAYFGKEPKRLSLAESALLVALPQSPENRRLDRFPNVARAARDRVLDRMVEESHVAAEAAQADADTRAAFGRSGDGHRERCRCHRADAGFQFAKGSRSAGARPRDRVGPKYFHCHHRGRQ
jgi:membrane carboxypeptidase/penicillin-binding protein PbpC